MTIIMIWLTADIHFGCTKLVEHSRTEFENVEHHDRYMLAILNQYVKRNDTLVIIGDFCREKPGRYRPQINCRNIFFILGNHDKESKIKTVFGGNVWQQRMVKLSNGEKVWCSHYPAAFWDRSHYGTYHAYGHIHNNQRLERMMDIGLPGRRSMDVGVDSAQRLLGAYRPFSEVELLYMLKNKSGHDIIKKG